MPSNPAGHLDVALECTGHGGSTQVLLSITHNLIQQNFQEILFDLSTSVLRVKERIHGLCGSLVSAMDVYLDGVPLSVDESNHEMMLGAFGPRNGGVLSVIDNDPHSLARGGAFHDVSLVKKYTMSDETYRARENTYYAYVRVVLYV